MSALIGLAWSLLVLVGARRRVPVPLRAELRTTGPPRGGARALRRSPNVVASSLAEFGTRLQRRATLLESLPALVVGALAATVLVLVTVSPALALYTTVGVSAWASLRTRARARRERELLIAQLPPAIDLFRMCLASGLTPRLALVRVAAASPAPLRDHLAPVAAQTERGSMLSVALGPLVGAGPPLAPFAAAVANADRSGVPLDGMLERQAASARARSRRRSQERARRLPVLMLLPMVCCSLPALLLVAVVPVIVHGLSSLAGS